MIVGENGQTVILHGETRRAQAKRLIDVAPAGSSVQVTPPRRSDAQNRKMQAMLSDVSRAKPGGRVLPPHKWKALFMDAAGIKPEWQPSLDGTSVVCTGYRSSRLVKAEMSDVIESIHAFGAEHGISFGPQEMAA